MFEDNREAIEREVAEELCLLERRAHQEDLPLRWSLMSLIYVTTSIGVTAGLIKSYGLIGACVVFVVACVISWEFSFDTNQPRQRFWIELMWGVLVPSAFLATDPWTFPTNRASFLVPELHTTSAAIWLYSCAGWLMMLLLLAWVMPRPGRFVAAIIAGQFIFAAVLWMCVAVTALPVAVVGTFSGIGIVGFAPCVACLIYRNAFSRYWSLVTDHPEYSPGWTGGPFQFSALASAILAATTGVVVAFLLAQH